MSVLDILKNFDVLQIGFFACLGAAVLLFIVSIILFVKLDIRSIMAARAERKSADAAAVSAGMPAAPRGHRHFRHGAQLPAEEGAERTVVLPPEAVQPDGAETTVVIPAIDAPAAPQGEFEIIKKVICSDTSETIL